MYQTFDTTKLSWRIINMKINKTLSSILFFFLSATLTFSQDINKIDSVSAQTEKQDINRRHSIGSSLFMVSNLLPDPASGHQVIRATFLLFPVF